MSFTIMARDRALVAARRRFLGNAGNLGDEAMHWAVLRQAVGDVPVPGPFVG